MTKAKFLAEVFSAMNPDTNVFCIYIDKDDVSEKVNDYLENLDENEIELYGNPSAETLVTPSFVEDVGDSIGNDDYLWERWNESFADTVYELLKDRLDEIKEDKELWDTETEKTDESRLVDTQITERL
jgi:hypothetical protein